MSSGVSIGGGATAPGAMAPFVGRSQELEILRRTRARAAAGRGELVLVAGEAGIGKTRLARGFAEEVPPGEALLVWSAAWDGGGAPAYWPWIQVVRGIVDDLGIDRARSLIPDWDTSVGLLVPGGGNLPTGARGDLDASARFALFDGISRFLHACSAARPVVIVLDDAHLVDSDSLQLLEFVARGIARAPVVIIATHRRPGAGDASAVAASLHHLRGGAAVIELGGLDEDGVAQLIRAREPSVASAALAARLHEVTDGNPLFVAESLRLLADEGVLGDPVGLREHTFTLPDGLRDTILARLSAVPDDVRGVLDVAAVIGRDFGLDVLAEACGTSPEGTREVIDRAVALRLVREADPLAARFAFRHGAVRESLYSQVSSRRRAECHGLVAQALEQHGREVHTSELAHHWIGAAPVVGPRRGLDAARTAADEAMASLAYARAAEFHAAALAALEQLPRDDDARCSLLLDRGAALMAGGDTIAARTVLDEAAALATAIGDAERVAKAAIASAPWGLSLSVADDPLLRMLLDALHTDGVSDATRARLLSALAVAGYWVTPPQERLDLVEEAITLARTGGDAPVLARALTDAHIATWDPDSVDRSFAWLDEVIELDVGQSHPELVLIAETCRISLLFEDGAVSRADEAIAAVARGAHDVHQPRAQTYVLRHAALRAGVEGRFADVEDLLGRQAALADLRVDSVDALLLSVQAFVMRWLQGRLPELEPMIREYADNLPVMPAWRCGLIAAHVQQDRREAVRRGFDELARDGFASLPRDNLYLAALTLLTDACAYLADRDGARALMALVAPYADRTAMVTDAALFAPMSRSMGRLSAVCGEREAALRWLARARDDAEVLGARPLVAHLLVDEAAVRHHLGGAAEQEVVAGLLHRADVLATELELGEVLRRVRELRPGGPSRPPAPTPAFASAGAAEPAGLAPIDPADPVAPTSPPRAPRHSATPARPALRRRGEVWEVRWDGEPFSIRDVKGMHHLARLLAEPDREFAALDLVGAAGLGGGTGPGVSELAQDGLHEDAGAHAVLDEEAKRAYRARLQELDEEIEEATAFNDHERAASAQEEREAIVHELAVAVGLRGRDRSFTSSGERARVNATRAIRSAIERITRADAALGRHLSVAVQTGTCCVYRPDAPGVAWDVEA